MERLSLNNLRFWDWYALYKIAKHPEFFYRALNDNKSPCLWRVTRYIGLSLMADHFHTGDRLVKAIRLDGQLVGCVLLAEIDWLQTGHAYVGLFISPHYQRHGVGRKAFLRFLDWAMENTACQLLEANVHPNNQASLKILTKAGLTHFKNIAAEDGCFLSKDGSKEPRTVLRGARSDVSIALEQARQTGAYSKEIAVT